MGRTTQFSILLSTAYDRTPLFENDNEEGLPEFPITIFLSTEPPNSGTANEHYNSTDLVNVLRPWLNHDRAFITIPLASDQVPGDGLPGDDYTIPSIACIEPLCWTDEQSRVCRHIYDCLTDAIIRNVKQLTLAT